MAEVVAQETNFKNVPDDVYDLRCVSYQIQEGKYGNYIQWVFEIVEGEHSKINVSAQTPGTLSPESKLHKFLKGFGYHTIVPEETKIDLDTCVDKLVKGFVETTPDKSDPEVKYSNVTKLVPRKKPDATAHEATDKVAPAPTVAEVLPPGWKKHHDAKSGKDFYENPEGGTQWEKPTSPKPETPVAPETSTADKPAAPDNSDWDKYQE